MLLNKLNALRCYCIQTNNNFYATTPIFYVNATPHIGHLYSAVITDALCRYERFLDLKKTVHLCTGTNEHGTKIQQAAVAQAVPVAQYCEYISALYRHVFAEASIANTNFIRTTEERHKKAIAHFWHALKSLGHIYSAAYSGWYCVSDETFLTESQLRLDTQSGARLSLDSGRPVEWTGETNYMFRLSQFQDDVRYWMKQGGPIRPAKFEKILLDMLSEALPNVSVSRPSNRVHWAIPVPDDETQTVYVWLDALINYLTSVGYSDEAYRKFWPPNLQVVGKDILKLHGIYWSAFLIAAGLEPPQQLFVHSHWTVDGQKMSKNKQNIVNPVEAAKTYTMEEGLRYFVLRECVAHSDGNLNIKDSMELKESIKHLTIEEDEVLISFDKWDKLEKYTKIDKKQFQAILDFCLRDNNYFTYNKTLYQQIYGMPMDNPLSPTIADIVLDKILDNSIAELKSKDIYVKYIAKYVDDVFAIVKTKDVEDILIIFNAQHTKIQFTKEIEQNNRIAFLDVEIHRRNKNLILNWLIENLLNNTTKKISQANIANELTEANTNKNSSALHMGPA
ncbi:methionine--tRNA ligase, mitochondrial-like [Eurosta solidaginis]|uniref:methionine--tRNA ligase, mitochondrial-like n=1 Tax=Eurosta solidaginis TaxID=178769 RepID=UPI003530E528